MDKCYYNAQGTYDCSNTGYGLQAPVKQMFIGEAKPINRESNKTFRQSTEVELHEFFEQPKSHSITPVAANSYTINYVNDVDFSYKSK